jgi:hypothetical protein
MTPSFGTALSPSPLQVRHDRTVDGVLILPRHAIVESWASDSHLRELWLAQIAAFTDVAVTRIEADRRADPPSRLASTASMCTRSPGHPAPIHN